MLTHADVEAAQQSWGQGLVAIGAAETHEKAHGLAEEFVREHYLLEDGTLLFVVPVLLDWFYPQTRRWHCN